MKRMSSISRRWRFGVLAALAAGAFSISSAAYALPQGGFSSTASIVTSGSTMNITGAENNLITWVDFSIGEGQKVAFDANNYLNYVTGHAASDILGTLAGQGTIYLVNPNGINIGDGALIDVGTLHLSTADLTGHLDSFDSALSAVNGATSFAGDVVNKGTLKAAQSITVEGNNITFKNVADVTAAGLVVKAKDSEAFHVGRKDSAVLSLGAGSTTPTYYQLITSADELKAIQNDPSGNYMLNNDINVGEISPLGDFTGKFDGVNYALQNIRINSDAANVGLFSKNSGTIENLVLAGGSVTGSITTGNFFGNEQNDSQSVGALAGQNTGIIRHVSNGNSVRGDISGQFKIGTYGGTATQYVGGLVGENAAGGKILASSNTGPVTGSIEANYRNKGHIGYDGGAVLQDVGGLAGKNAGRLEESYNIATVSGNMSSLTNMGETTSAQTKVEEYVGGLVGENIGSIVNAYQGDSAVTGSLSAKEFVPQGNATIIEAVGGIAGKNSGTIETVYSQGTASGSKLGDNSERVTVSFNPLVGTGTEAVNSYTENLTTAATFGAWGDKLTADGSNKNAVWRIYEGKTAPLLTAFMKRKDNYLGSKVYDGTAQVGNSAVPSTNTSTQQEGINWVSDITLITPASTPDTPSSPSSPSTPSSGSGTSSGTTSTPTSVPIPAPVTETTPGSDTTPVTPPASAQTEPSTAASTPAAAQAIERQMEAQGVDAKQLEAATNSITSNVQSSTAATASSVGVTAPATVTSSAETEASSNQTAAASAATAQVSPNLSWGADGMLTLESKGVNAPVSMQMESLVAPAGNNTSTVTATPAAGVQTVAQNSGQPVGSSSVATAGAPAAVGQTVAQNNSQPAGNSAAGAKKANRDSNQSVDSSENAQGQKSTQSGSADSTEGNGENRDSEERE
ncbi:MAG: filamentous hemagglutinin N-terminal domain-containing protein [Selenomonas sp.]|nr:filamentous hemagglutinin N-terminal domain-containing protein [Selenomonas sp.]